VSEDGSGIAIPNIVGFAGHAVAVLIPCIDEREDGAFGDIFQQTEADEPGCEPR